MFLCTVLYMYDYIVLNYLSFFLFFHYFNIKTENRDRHVDAIEKALIFDPHLGVRCTKYGISYATLNILNSPYTL